MCILNNISASLEFDDEQSFYKMLEIMQDHGNLHARQLAENMKAFIKGIDPIVIIENTEVVVASIGGMYIIHTCICKLRVYSTAQFNFYTCVAHACACVFNSCKTSNLACACTITCSFGMRTWVSKHM